MWCLHNRHSCSNRKDGDYESTNYWSCDLLGPSYLYSAFLSQCHLWHKIWDITLTSEPQTPTPLITPPDSCHQGGLVYSNAVTTVSPTYANEVLNGGAAGWLRTTLLRPEIKAKARRHHGGIGTTHMHCRLLTCKGSSM